MNSINDINKRNTQTVEQALKDMYAKIYAQQSTIDVLNAGLSALHGRLDSLERQLLMQRAKSFGAGPSV